MKKEKLKQKKNGLSIGSAPKFTDQATETEQSSNGY